MAAARASAQPAIGGLHALASEVLPFAPSLEIRTFLLERDPGNLLVYGSGAVGPDAVGDRGGADRLYLGHRHEAMFLPAEIAAPVYCHEAERDAVSEKAPVGGTFAARHVVDGDFEAIPIPGHTSGATAYLWDSGRARLLFTGDTISLQDREWVAAVLESSDPEAYGQSLELLREVEFDVLVPWAVSVGGPAVAPTDRRDARRRIDAMLERLRGRAPAG